ncbi:DUF1302 family protein, partial [Planctomycetota bacterium]
KPKATKRPQLAHPEPVEGRRDEPVQTAKTDRRRKGAPEEKKGKAPSKKSPKIKKKKRISRWAIVPLLAVLLAVWLGTVIAAHYVARVGGRRDREQLEGQLDDAIKRRREQRIRLTAGLEEARTSHREAADALEEKVVALERGAVKARADWKSEQRRLRAESQQRLQEVAQAAQSERERQVAASEQRTTARARRERLDLERGVRDTVNRYEALLVQAERANGKLVELVRREARAEVLRRETALRNELEARVAELQAQQQEEIKLEAERIEERLRLELQAAGGGDEGLLGGDDTFGMGAPEGLDLEREVWTHLTGTLSGSAEYKMFAHFKKGSAAEARYVRNEGMLTLQYEVDPTDWMTLLAKPRVHVDDGDLSQGSQTDFVDRRQRRPIFALDEAYLSATLGDLDLRLGKLKVSFGSADLRNPTDVLNPPDFTDLLDTRRIGVPAVEAAYYLLDGELKLLGMWVPVFTPARFAPPGKRFAPVPVDLPITVPLGLLMPNLMGWHLSLEEAELPPRTLRDSDAIVRIATTIESVDLSVTALTQHNPVPMVAAVVNPSQQSVRLIPFYNRQYMFGADFATVVLDDWVANGEVAQFMTDGETGDDYLSFVGGVRRNFYPLDREVGISLEYSGEWRTRKIKDSRVVLARELQRNFADDPPDLQRIFANALLYRLSLQPVNHLDVTVAGAVLFNGKESFYVQPEVRYEVGNHTRLAVGFDLVGGSEESFFGTLKEHKRFYLSFKLAF